MFPQCGERGAVECVYSEGEVCRCQDVEGHVGKTHVCDRCGGPFTTDREEPDDPDSRARGPVG